MLWDACPGGNADVVSDCLWRSLDLSCTLLSSRKDENILNNFEIATSQRGDPLVNLTISECVAFIGNVTDELDCINLQVADAGLTKIAGGPFRSIFPSGSRCSKFRLD